MKANFENWPFELFFWNNNHVLNETKNDKTVDRSTSAQATFSAIKKELTPFHLTA